MTTKITKDNVTSGTLTTTEISDGTIANVDIASNAAIGIAKIDGAASSSDLNTIKDNIGLLGFKMAVNEGLTVFNFVDGVVDEFNDESGTDESESSNDNYVAADDIYTNNFSSGNSFVQFSSNNFGNEPDTVTSGTGGNEANASFAAYAVPSGMTSITVKSWGAGAGGLGPGGGNWGQPFSAGGGGGYVEGDIAVTPGQTIYIGTASNGSPPDPSIGAAYGGGASVKFTTRGAGAGLVTNAASFAQISSAPQLYLVSGGGGGAMGTTGRNGGAGGGLSGQAGSGGNGGSQNAGGTPGGGFLEGGNRNDGPNPWAYYGLGGGGYYGGGTAQGPNGQDGQGGGGGSSYYGNPSISNGATEGGSGAEGGGTTGEPEYGVDTPSTVNEGYFGPPEPSPNGPEAGFTLLTGSFEQVGQPGGGDTTLVSATFSAQSAPSSARIVVFNEDVDTPTLNTDVIAAVSRDGGTTYSNATLSDSGYVTGSSGQKILTGTADISGQPSGTNMRWKLTLANATVKVHGVSLQWS